MRISLPLFLTLCCMKLQAQDSCKITYISNEGFLLETNGKKVLIDGLFEHIDENWEAFVKHFQEVENITIFEAPMESMYYETSR